MQDGKEEEIKVQRCRNSPRCFHRLLIDMPQRDVREIQEGREIPLTVDLARLPRYLDLLEDCFQGKELASKLEQAKIDGFALNCGDHWILDVLLPARISLTIQFRQYSGLEVGFEWKGVHRFMPVDQMRQLLQALFFQPMSEFYSRLVEHGLERAGAYSIAVESDPDPASVALRSIGLPLVNSLHAYGIPRSYLARWKMVAVSVDKDGSIKYTDVRRHYADETDYTPVKDAQEMRRIIDAQNELTFPRFYAKYFEKKNHKPDRKRKAPRRWGFDEQ